MLWRKKEGEGRKRLQELDNVDGIVPKIIHGKINRTAITIEKME